MTHIFCVMDYESYSMSWIPSFNVNVAAFRHEIKNIRCSLKKMSLWDTPVKSCVSQLKT